MVLSRSNTISLGNGSDFDIFSVEKKCLGDELDSEKPRDLLNSPSTDNVKVQGIFLIVRLLTFQEECTVLQV